MIKIFIDDQIMQRILSGLFDQVKSKIGLNLNYLEKRCQEKYGIEKIEGVEHKDGNIVVYKDQIACQLNYEVRFPVSVLITTREKVNSSLSPDNDRRSETDVLSKHLGDVSKESDDFLEAIDDVTLDLDDFLEDVDEIEPELDLEDLEPEHDLIDEPMPKTHASKGH